MAELREDNDAAASADTVLGLLLSRRRLVAHARDVPLKPEVHAITYPWGRLPTRLPGALHPVDELGSRPRAANFGHKLLLIALSGTVRTR
jgi:hypothetical protein